VLSGPFKCNREGYYLTLNISQKLYVFCRGKVQLVLMLPCSLLLMRGARCFPHLCHGAAKLPINPSDMKRKCLGKGALDC
jgi:hypothetical protein